jgi:hypothetical protein
MNLMYRSSSSRRTRRRMQANNSSSTVTSTVLRSEGHPFGSSSSRYPQAGSTIRARDYMKAGHGEVGSQAEAGPQPMVTAVLLEEPSM